MARQNLPRREVAQSFCGRCRRKAVKNGHYWGYGDTVLKTAFSMTKRPAISQGTEALSSSNALHAGGWGASPCRALCPIFSILAVAVLSLAKPQKPAVSAPPSTLSNFARAAVRQRENCNEPIFAQENGIPRRKTLRPRRTHRRGRQKREKPHPSRALLWFLTVWDGRVSPPPRIASRGNFAFSKTAKAAGSAASAILFDFTRAAIRYKQKLQ